MTGKPLECIGVNIYRLWTAGRFATDDCTTHTQTGGFAERNELRSLLHGICTVWTRQLDAIAPFRQILLQELIQALVNRMGKLNLDQNEDDLVILRPTKQDPINSQEME